MKVNVDSIKGKRLVLRYQPRFLSLGGYVRENLYLNSVYAKSFNGGEVSLSRKEASALAVLGIAYASDGLLKEIRESLKEKSKSEDRAVLWKIEDLESVVSEVTGKSVREFGGLEGLVEEAMKVLRSKEPVLEVGEVKPIEKEDVLYPIVVGCHLAVSSKPFVPFFIAKFRYHRDRHDYKTALEYTAREIAQAQDLLFAVKNGYSLSSFIASLPDFGKKLFTATTVEQIEKIQEVAGGKELKTDEIEVKTPELIREGVSIDKVLDPEYSDAVKVSLFNFLYADVMPPGLINESIESAKSEYSVEELEAVVNADLPELPESLSGIAEEIVSKVKEELSLEIERRKALEKEVSSLGVEM